MREVQCHGNRAGHVMSCTQVSHSMNVECTNRDGKSSLEHVVYRSCCSLPRRAREMSGDSLKSEALFGPKEGCIDTGQCVIQSDRVTKELPPLLDPSKLCEGEVTLTSAFQSEAIEDRKMENGADSR